MQMWDQKAAYHAQSSWEPCFKLLCSCRLWNAVNFGPLKPWATFRWDLSIACALIPRAVCADEVMCQSSQHGPS